MKYSQDNNINGSDEQEINIEDTPCFSCPKLGSPCKLSCPKLELYGTGTEILPEIHPARRREIDPTLDKIARGDVHKAMEKEHIRMAEELDKKWKKPRSASAKPPIFTEEDPPYDPEAYDIVAAPISLVKVDKMMTYFQEKRIIKSYEKELAEQVRSYMRCSKIAEIARLAGEDNRQNLHIKISRRIEKFGRLLLKDTTLMAKVKRDLNITIEDVLTPHKFKQYLRVES